MTKTLFLPLLFLFHYSFSQQLADTYSRNNYWKVQSYTVNGGLCSDASRFSPRSKTQVYKVEKDTAIGELVFKKLLSAVTITHICPLVYGPDTEVMYVAQKGNVFYEYDFRTKQTRTTADFGELVEGSTILIHDSLLIKKVDTTLLGTEKVRLVTLQSKKDSSVEGQYHFLEGVGFLNSGPVPDYIGRRSFEGHSMLECFEHNRNYFKVDGSDSVSIEKTSTSCFVKSDWIKPDSLKPFFIHTTKSNVQSSSKGSGGNQSINKEEYQEVLGDTTIGVHIFKMLQQEILQTNSMNGTEVGATKRRFLKNGHNSILEFDPLTQTVDTIFYMTGTAALDTLIFPGYGSYIASAVDSVKIGNDTARIFKFPYSPGDTLHYIYLIEGVGFAATGLIPGDGLTCSLEGGGRITCVNYKESFYTFEGGCFTDQPLEFVKTSEMCSSVLSADQTHDLHNSNIIEIQGKELVTNQIAEAILITDLTGRIHVRNFQSSHTDLSRLGTGMYVAVIQVGSKKMVYKFVISE